MSRSQPSAARAATLAGKGLLSRPGLFDVLDRAVSGRVTVVSAPPGSGKTTVLRSWIDRGDHAQRVAWVSVERGERDAQRFWMSVVTELRTAAGGDASVDELTPSPQFDGGAVASGELSHENMTLDARRAHVYGDVAVVTVRGTNNGTYKGEPFAADEWSTDVFVLSDGEWRWRAQPPGTC